MLENTQIFVGQAILSYDSTSTMYKPTFTITNNILKLCQSIGKELGFLEGTKILTPSVQLRKDNQVKTIYSSLAIEGNRLSEELITQILEGKRVIIAPKNDIIEVQNALVVYKNLHQFNPVTQNSILEANKILMKSLIIENGIWRSVGVIISKDVVSHVAPRAKMVPDLMNQLFNFLKNEAELPWLIKACVFHYELEFIHPFSDGNGRIGRLW